MEEKNGPKQYAYVHRNSTSTQGNGTTGCSLPSRAPCKLSKTRRIPMVRLCYSEWNGIIALTGFPNSAPGGGGGVHSRSSYRGEIDYSVLLGYLLRQVTSGENTHRYSNTPQCVRRYKTYRRRQFLTRSTCVCPLSHNQKELVLYFLTRGLL